MPFSEPWRPLFFAPLLAPLSFFCPSFFSPLVQNKLTAEQRGQVNSFREFTSASIGQAIKCLTQNKWNVELAANDFFMNPPSPEPEQAGGQGAWSEQKTRALFDK